MGKPKYDKEIAVHWHQTNKALTACGQPWRVFWGDEEPEAYSRGRLPYGEASTTLTKVTCQACLEARYKAMSVELESLHERIDIFWKDGKKKKSAKNAEADKRVMLEAFGKKISAYAVSEYSKLVRELQ